MDLIDLINSRHMQLRIELENNWNQMGSFKMNNTEWHVLGKLYNGKNTIADITKEVHVSRQATHKLIKNLEQKELISIYDDPLNKKIKKVKLTSFGLECYEQYKAMKKQLEHNIMQSIGEVTYQQLIQGLGANWDLSNAFD